MACIGLVTIAVAAMLVRLWPERTSLMALVQCTDAGSVSVCQSLVKYCNDETFRIYMKDRCASTCGFCGKNATSISEVLEEECRDSGFDSDCRRFVENEWCNDPMFRSYLVTNCARTCNLCPNTCKDSQKYTVQCRQLANVRRCNASFYRKFAEENCAKSCGRCGLNSGPATSTFPPIGSFDYAELGRSNLGYCDDKVATATCVRYRSSGYCDDVKLKPYMEQYCAKTCAFCADYVP